MAESRYLHCLYAEDVRPEIAGTFSVIGAYQGGMQMPTLPATLPRLAIIASICFPVTDSFETLRVEVLLDDKLLQGVDTPKAFVDDSLQKAKAHNERTGRNGFIIQLMISLVGIQIEQAGRIYTRAYMDGELLEGNSLEITEAPQP